MKYAPPHSLLSQSFLGFIQVIFAIIVLFEYHSKFQNISKSTFHKETSDIFLGRDNHSTSSTVYSVFRTGDALLRPGVDAWQQR